MSSPSGICASSIALTNSAIYFENHKDIPRARNVWQRAADAWQKRAGGEVEPDTFIWEQIQSHLGKHEEDAGNLSLAIRYWEQAKTHAANPAAIQDRMDELRQKLSSPD